MNKSEIWRAKASMMHLHNDRSTFVVVVGIFYKIWRMQTRCEREKNQVSNIVARKCRTKGSFVGNSFGADDEKNLPKKPFGASEYSRVCSRYFTCYALLAKCKCKIEEFGGFALFWRCSCLHANSQHICLLRAVMFRFWCY